MPRSKSGAMAAATNCRDWGESAAQNVVIWYNRTTIQFFHKETAMEDDEWMKRHTTFIENIVTDLDARWKRRAWITRLVFSSVLCLVLIIIFFRNVLFG